MSGSEDTATLAAENERLRREVDSLKSAPAGRGSARIRGTLTGILVVLTAISVVATTAGFWMNRTIWNTDRFVALVAPLADNRAVTDGLAVKLTQDAFEALDVQGRVEDALASIEGLPEGADALLAGPLTSATRNLVQDKVEQFLASDTFSALWTQVVERAHEKIVALLDGDLDQLPNLAVNDGQVQLNMVSAVAQILRNVSQQGAEALGLNVTIPDIPPDLASSEAIQRLGSAVGVTLPPDFGQVTIMSENQLMDYQQAAHRIQQLSGALFVISCILLVMAIVVSPNRRRTLIWLGVGIAVGLFVGGVVIRRFEARLLETITNPSGDAAAREVFATAAAGLRRIGLEVLVVAILVALAAHLFGRPRWAERSVSRGRQLTARRPEGSELEVWLSSHADAVRIGGAVVASVVLFLTGINWIALGIVLALYAGLWWAVSASIRRTGADATPEVPE